MAVCATICGADNWEEIAEFGESKREWFATFLELENGIPSHDTFRRVFILLDNIELKTLFVDWIGAAISLSKGTLVQYRRQEFVRQQRADKRQESVKCGQCVGIGAIRGVRRSAVRGEIKRDDGDSRTIENLRFGRLHRGQ